MALFAVCRSRLSSFLSNGCKAARAQSPGGLFS